MFCYVPLSNFLLELYSFCWLNKEDMNAKEKMHEVRFPSIYILSHIIYYIVPLAVIIVLAVKALGFSKVRQTLSTTFAMRYDDIKDEVWISLLGIFIISDQKIYLKQHSL